MDNLLAEFINETRDLVQQASQDFLKIEENPEDRELINSLFRAMHTIKGSSGVFELIPLTDLVHEAENILDRAREGKLKLSGEIIDVFLDILDQINMWMDELETDQKLGSDADSYSKNLKKKLRKVTEGLVGTDSEEAKDKVLEKKKTKVQEVIELDKEVLEGIAKLPLMQRISVIKQLPSWNEELFFVVYEPDENCFFSGDDPLLTLRKTPNLLAYFCEPKQPWPKEEEFDPFKCNLRFYLLSSAAREELDGHFMYVMDEVRVYQIRVIDLVIPSGEIIPNDQLDLFVKDATELLEKQDFSSILKAVEVAKEITSEESFQHSILSLLEAGLSKSPLLPEPWVLSLIEAIKKQKFELPKELEVKEKDLEANERKTTLERVSIDPILEDIIKKQIELLTVKCPEDVKVGQLKSIKTVLVNILNNYDLKEMGKEVEQELNSLIGDFSFNRAGEVQKKFEALLLEVEKAMVKKRTEEEEKSHIKESEMTPQPKLKNTQIKTEVKVLKVDQEQIDELMDLVSELVVAKNALPYLAKRAEEEFQSRELGRELKNQYATINRICEDLQNIVMQIRMIPVSHVFQRFPRLVRDMARKLNKKVKLIIEGEETRADKNVIEKMADPLVHLIRNSVDHGIEPPEERVTKGKLQEGHVILSASQLEDQVLIEVRDDGKGIDVKTVKQKAYEKGLIDEETLEKMTPQEALELIFAPGLSTAKEISDVSGRGVGMDAVRAMVEEVGGKVDVKTDLGKGTTISLSLPLSMAVTRILMIEVAGELFGIPIENVSETVKVPPSEIHKVKDKEVIVLRERIIPLFRLKDILEINSQIKEKRKQSLKFYDQEEIAVLIVALERYEFGLVVDQFHEGIDIVLKPLEGFMGKFTLYSGATLLGDGRVLLVLNPKELVKWL